MMISKADLLALSLCLSVSAVAARAEEVDHYNPGSISGCLVEGELVSKIALSGCRIVGPFSETATRTIEDTSFSGILEGVIRESNAAADNRLRLRP